MPIPMPAFAEGGIVEVDVVGRGARSRIEGEGMEIGAGVSLGGMSGFDSTREADVKAGAGTGPLMSGVDEVGDVRIDRTRVVLCWEAGATGSLERGNEDREIIG